MPSPFCSLRFAGFLRPAHHVSGLAVVVAVTAGLFFSPICPAATYGPGEVKAPALVREYRAVWVATVGNIDWPSQKGLSTADQKAELLAILDRAEQLRLNAIIFQVRPACDALYASSIEPWSEYLTGTAGKAPEPFYDPLTFAVEEAHKRGLELHAWFNPYRAKHISAKSPLPANHISKTKPQLVREYGDYLWLDPGEPEVQDYSLGVVMDVVKRYDIDGVHFDDYFYPYKERAPSGGELDFPDRQSWQKYGASGKLSRDDWRRENVNRFIERVYRGIKSAKPWVKFGVSPFGIWRPGYPAQIRGFDAYDKLYADSRKWLANGWVDYFAPQLYWAIKPPEQSYPVLLKWWAQQNKRNRHLVPGMDTTKTARRWPPEEIVEQIRLTRRQTGASGHIHWNMRSLLRNATLGSALKSQVYTQTAVVPALSWMKQPLPRRPDFSAKAVAGRVALSWQKADTIPLRWWALQVRRDGVWTTQLLPESRRSLELEGKAPDAIALRAVDRFGNASVPAGLKLAEGPR